MHVGLALEIDSTIDHLAAAVVDLNQALETYFSDREFGPDVENIFIGIILTGPGSEKFHRVRKLKYKKMHKIRIPGHAMDFKNVVEYDVKPDFEKLCRMHLKQARRQLSTTLLNSLSILEVNRAKFPNFDVSHFKEAMKICLERNESEHAQ